MSFDCFLISKCRTSCPDRCTFAKAFASFYVCVVNNNYLWSSSSNTSFFPGNFVSSLSLSASQCSLFLPWFLILCLLLCLFLKLHIILHIILALVEAFFLKKFLVLIRLFLVFWRDIVTLLKLLLDFKQWFSTLTDPALPFVFSS